MIKHSFSDFSYAINTTSAKKGRKEILVCFIYNGVEVLKKVYIPEKPGTAYVFEAKKIIDQEMRSGALSAYSHKFVKRKNKEAAKKKKMEEKAKVKAQAASNKPEVKKPDDPKKKKRFSVVTVVVVAVAVALVVGLTAGLATYFATRNDQPVPSDSLYKVNFDIDESADVYTIDGPKTVESGKQYSCTFITEHDGYEVLVSSVLMNGIRLVANKDYSYIDKKLEITKPADGDIYISGSVRKNSFSVYPISYGCEFVNAKTTIGINETYKCTINPNEGKRVVIDGVTMGGEILETPNDYTYDSNTKEFSITKKSFGHIQIIAHGEDMVVNEFAVHDLTSSNCTFVGPQVAQREQSYKFSIITELDNYDINLLSVVVGSKVITANLSPQPVSTETAHGYSYTIPSTEIDGEVYITASAVLNDSDYYQVVKKAVNCSIIGGATIGKGLPYTCQISCDDSLELEIISVTMGGIELVKGSDYSYNEENENLSIVKGANGIINIFAIGRQPEVKNYGVVLSSPLNDCTLTGSDLVNVNEKYQATITANDSDYVVKISSVRMGGRSLAPDAVNGYSYNSDTGDFKVNVPTDGNIIIIVYTEKKTLASYPIIFGSYGCTITSPTPTPTTSPYGDNFTCTIKADDEDKTPQIISIYMGGTKLSNNGDSPDYTFTEENGLCTLYFNKKTSGLIEVYSIAVDQRDSYGVTINSYGVTFLNTSNTIGKNGIYTSKIQVESMQKAKIVSVIMGGKNIPEGTDNNSWQFIGDTLTVKRPADGDLIISAIAIERDKITGTPVFEINGDNTVRVKQIMPDDNYEISDVQQIVIPSAYEDSATNQEFQVTEINNGVLYGCSSLESLTIPFIGNKLTYAEDASPYDKLFGYIFGTRIYDGCGSITWQAFYMDELKTQESYRIRKAAIPTSLSKIVVNGGTIPQGAFSACRHITSVEINGFDTNTVGAYAFDGCKSLHTVTFNPKPVASPERINKIEWNAFSDCSTLETLDLSYVDTIRSYAFNNCSGLSGLFLPFGLINVGSNAFAGISSGVIACEQTRSEVEEKMYSSEPTWAENWVGDTTQVIYGFSAGTTYISEDGDWKYIITRKDGTSREEPEYGASIIEYLGNDHAETISIPASFTVDSTTYGVIEIGTGVFYEYSLLENVVFTNAASLQFIGNYAFMNCASLTSITGLNNTSLLRLGNYAFDRCANLVVEDTEENHIFPDTVTDLGICSFGYCSSLKSIYLKDCLSLNTVGDRLFYECGKQEVNPEDPTDITYSGLSSVTLPTVLRDVGGEVFTRCYALSELELTVDNVDTLPDSLCEDCVGLTKFTWKYSSGSATHLINIGAKAFKGCTTLANVYLENSTTNQITTNVMSIGDEAFANCKSIRSFYLGEVGNSIRKYAFKIGENVFYNWGSSPSTETQTLWANFSTNDSTGWATFHSALSGTTITSFGWILGFGPGASVLGDHYWLSGNTGSSNLYIRDSQ